MKASEILTNEFLLRYDEDTESLLIHTVNDGKPTKFPIRLSLNTLQGMGSEKAAQWVGESILLLIPAIRERLFDLPNEPA